MEPTLRAGLGKTVALWILAVLLTLSAALWQRLTGPSHPMRGTLAVGQTEISYRLIRNHETDSPAVVTLPAGDSVAATMHWRRYPLDEPFTAVPMARAEDEEGDEWSAPLPVQPAAGKVEYWIDVELADGATHKVPVGGEMPVLRYKDPVALWVLIPHVAAMFFAMLFGVRAALAAIAQPAAMRRWTLIAFVLLSLGGLLLGPIVQKQAFGAYWTGWPFGEDLTDNKTLFGWIAWAVAAAFVWRPAAVTAKARIAVVAAMVVMLGVYLVPHSARGSELDYGAVDAGADPTEAVGQGR